MLTQFRIGKLQSAFQNYFSISTYVYLLLYFKLIKLYQPCFEVLLIKNHGYSIINVIALASKHL